MEFLQNVCLAHLQLLMNTSAKYQGNWTEAVGVVRTRFCGQTDRPTDRQADSSIPPKLRLRGYGKNFSERVENTVGKGDIIACYEQFLLFPQCFQKTCTAVT